MPVSSGSQQVRQTMRLPILPAESLVHWGRAPAVPRVVSSVVRIQILVGCLLWQASIGGSTWERVVGVYDPLVEVVLR